MDRVRQDVHSTGGRCRVATLPGSKRRIVTPSRSLSGGQSSTQAFGQADNGVFVACTDRYPPRTAVRPSTPYSPHDPRRGWRAAGVQKANAVDHAPQVHVDDPPPVLLGRLPLVAQRPHPGVVADHVDAAECGHRRLASSPYRLQAGNVHDNTQHVAAPGWTGIPRPPAVPRSISASTTRAPSARKASTIPKPMPLAAPVTTATRPLRSSMLAMPLNWPHPSSLSRGSSQSDSPPAPRPTGRGETAVGWRGGRISSGWWWRSPPHPGRIGVFWPAASHHSPSLPNQHVHGHLRERLVGIGGRWGRLAV